jgi:hypothetical protein
MWILRESGAPDALFARIDAGELQLTGDGGFVPGLIKAALERGLQAELTDHAGYEKGAIPARSFPNSRNGASRKTFATEVGDIVLDVPRTGPAASRRGWSPRASGCWAGSTTTSSRCTPRHDHPRHRPHRCLVGRHSAVRARVATP